MRILGALFALVLVLAAGAFLLAGRAVPPAIQIAQPARFVGQDGTLEVLVTSPKGELSSLEVAVEQGGQRIPLGSLGSEGLALKQDAEDRVKITRPLGKRSVPQLAAGPARVLVRAARPVLFGLREVSSDAAQDVQVRLELPRVGIVSMHHHVNHGGSEFVLYRTTPPDVTSGVRVGDREYPGFPAAGAGIPTADPALRVAFFALAWDQDLTAPIKLFARDVAGNETTADFEYRVFPKPFRNSKIDLPDAFLQRVVPAILGNTPSLKVSDPDDLLASFLVINRDLRRENNEAIKALAAKTGAKMLWTGPFAQLGNSQVEAAFADKRTYFFKGEEVDRQVHLGYDLAVTANVPVQPANAGTVVFAGWLGIYGNCVVVDHGLGVQSLYAHLSSIDAREGDQVEASTVLGRSGMTGLAGGDHLHFTMLVNGEPVTPVDWWSRQWMEDRVLRKLREAGAAAQPAATSGTTAPGAAAEGTAPVTPS
jgi:murein DD-endopeptidase MepM/ murein hydrolase activator NlpD